MFTTINNYINESFEVHTPKTKGDILDSADKVIRDYDWIVTSESPLIKDNEVTIQRKPSAFAPFRAIGTVRFTVSQNLEKTSIKCNIYPYDNSFPYIIILGIGLMTTWTFVGLILSTSKTSLLVLGLGWAIAIVYTYISMLTNKKRLKNYAATIIGKLVK